jgi:hypothetical protein
MLRSCLDEFWFVESVRVTVIPCKFQLSQESPHDAWSNATAMVPGRSARGLYDLDPEDDGIKLV